MLAAMVSRPEPMPIATRADSAQAQFLIDLCMDLSIAVAAVSPLRSAASERINPEPRFGCDVDHSWGLLASGELPSVHAVRRLRARDGALSPPLLRVPIPN